MNFDNYDTQIHELFVHAFTIRTNTGSTATDLLSANECINQAINLCNIMEAEQLTNALQKEVLNNKLRCYIEQLAIYTRLLKLMYNTPEFNEISAKHKQLCLQYINIKTPVINNDISQSKHQLSIIVHQSLAANYFQQGKLTQDAGLLKEAVKYINKAIELTEGDDKFKILHTNKIQIETALKQSQSN